MKQLPFALIYSRLFIGLFFFYLPLMDLNAKSYFLTILLFVGLLTDVFDGIVARKVGVSSEKLRTMDSNVDVVFWFGALISLTCLHPEAIGALLFPIIGIIAIELLAYALSFMKFRKTIATHALSAKLWALSIFVFMLELCLNGTTYTFTICFWIGLLSRLEIIAIILGLKRWANDVPSVFSVRKINFGLPVKKLKLFNG